jgi:membrane protein
MTAFMRLGLAWGPLAGERLGVAQFSRAPGVGVKVQASAHRRPRNDADVARPRSALTRLGMMRQVRRLAHERNLALLAAGTAFWAVLSIFPAIIAMVTIYGIVASPSQVTREVSKLGGSLSPSTREVVQKWLAGLTTSRGLGIGLAIGLGAVLWAVSSGVQTASKAINAAYEQEDDRGFFRLRGLALVISVGVVVLAIVVLSAIGLAPALSHLVHNKPARIAMNIGEWIVLAVILTGAIGVLYRFAPAHPPSSWRWISPGAVFSTVMVVVASIGFSFYVRFFGNYNKTYGALGGVVILMLWLYYSIYVVLLGAMLNAELERRAEPDAVAYPSA